LESSNHGRERLSDFTGKTEAYGYGSDNTQGSGRRYQEIRGSHTEDCVHDMIRHFKGLREIVDEGNVQVFQLLGESLNGSPAG